MPSPTSVESLRKTPEQSGVSLRDFGTGRMGHQIGVVGMEKALITAFVDIREKNNPHISIVKLYQLFAEQLPFSISTESQLAVAQAIASKNPYIAEVGTKAFILLNMKPILSAAGPFLTRKPDADSDLIQAGITHLLEKLSKPRTESQINNTYRYVYASVQTGITQEIAGKENLLPVIPVSDLQSDTGPVTGEEELIAAAFQPELKEAVDNALGGLSGPEQTIIKARFYFWGREYTLEETGKLIGRTRERARQIEAKAVRKLKHPRFSHKLKPYLFPERFGVISRKKQPLPKYDFIDMSAQANKHAPDVLLVDKNLVNPTSLEYRYPLVRLGRYRSYYRRITGIWRGLGLNKDITAQLEKNGIKNLTQLLARSDYDLTEIEFTPEQIRQIQTQVIEFLTGDARAIPKIKFQLLDYL